MTALLSQRLKAWRGHFSAQGGPPLERHDGHTLIADLAAAAEEIGSIEERRGIARDAATIKARLARSCGVITAHDGEMLAGLIERLAANVFPERTNRTVNRMEPGKTQQSFNRPI